MHSFKLLAIGLVGLTITARAVPAVAMASRAMKVDERTPRPPIKPCSAQPIDATVEKRSIEDVGPFAAGDYLGCGM